MKYWIWGAGDSGIELCKQINSGKNRFVVGFVDSNPFLWGKKLLSKFVIVSPSEFRQSANEETRVFISVKEDAAKAEIYGELSAMGIKKSHIEFVRDSYSDARFEFLKHFAWFVYDLHIPGNAAECGVYRGRFAAKINRCFYDRKLYLFDTFEGFDSRDISKETDLSDIDYTQDGVFGLTQQFLDTSVKTVMSEMPFADNVEIRKGWIPEVFAGGGG